MIIRTFITHNAGISTAASTAPADEWWDRQRQESFVAKTKTYLEPKRDNEKNVNVVWRITNQNSSQTTVHAALVWAEHRKTTFPQRRTFKLQKTAVALGLGHLMLPVTSTATTSTSVSQDAPPSPFRMEHIDSRWHLSLAKKNEGLPRSNQGSLLGGSEEYFSLVARLCDTSCRKAHSQEIVFDALCDVHDQLNRASCEKLASLCVQHRSSFCSLYSLSVCISRRHRRTDFPSVSL